MALTQFSGSLSWLQLCGLAAAFCKDVVSQRTRMAFLPHLVYQPSHLEHWSTNAVRAAHVIPHRQGSVTNGYAVTHSSFFRWVRLIGTGEVRARKMYGDRWALEYEGLADTEWHRLVRDACDEPTEPAATARVLDTDVRRL